MYGENGAAMRRELAALLRQHRIQHRIGGPAQPDRAALGQQILQYRQNLLIWCTQAMQATSPLLFSNLPTKQANPFRVGRPGITGAGELARALEHAKAHSSAQAASIEQLTTPSDNPVVEHWRELARAAVLAEHDTAPEVASHLNAPQAQALVGDVAAVAQALVVLDQRYKNTPGWEQLPQAARLGWAALAAALDVNLGQPDYTVDRSGWRPTTKPILGPTKPGILGVLQAEHNLAVRLNRSSPRMTNLRLIVDSQRILSSRLAPFATRIDIGLAERWLNRAATYTTLQRQLRGIGGRLGDCGLAAADGANAVTRLSTLPSDTIVEPRTLGGFQTLFHQIDTRIADVVEDGIERGSFVKRVTVPRLVTGTGQLVQPVRERYLPVTRPSDLDVVQTVRNELRPRPHIEAVGPGPTRADLHEALIHRPEPRDPGSLEL
ncbi:hypothetical protein [Nocardioides allogilvus]|uniref:hypothetical protein n=1 Tax=Nocardioides allogilvus TaxID=2072017 RepID=UPI000D30CD96|nr:hypothetical protein [Nocardioides allogilvus]